MRSLYLSLSIVSDRLVCVLLYVAGVRDLTTRHAMFFMFGIKGDLYSLSELCFMNDSHIQTRGAAATIHCIAVLWVVKASSQLTLHFLTGVSE